MPFECYCSINGKKLSVEYIPSDNDNNNGNDLMESLSQVKMTRIPQQVLFIRFPWHNTKAIQDLELFFQFYQARLTYVCFQETKPHEPRQRRQRQRRFNAPHDHDNNNDNNNENDDGPLLLAPVLPFFHCWNNNTNNTNSCAIESMTFWHPIRIGPHFQLPPKLQTLRIVMGRPRDDDLCLLLLLQDCTRLLQQQQQQHLSLKCLELEGLTIREEEEEDNNNNNNKMIIKELQGMMQVLQNHPTLEHVRFIDCHFPKCLAKFLQDPPSNLQELHLITSVSNIMDHHHNNTHNHHDAVDASLLLSSSSSSCQTILTALARLLSSKPTNDEGAPSSTLRKLVLRNQTPTTTARRRRRRRTDDDNNNHNNIMSSWDWATTLFLEGLKHNTSLVELELQCPNLHQQDIQCLLQALEYNTTLLSLTIESSSLSSNNNHNDNHNDKQQQNWMSDETLSLWADSLHLISLQELHLIHDDNSNNNNVAINHHDYNGNLFLHHNEYNNDNHHHQPLLLYGPKTIQRLANAMPGNYSLERFEIIPSYNNSSIFYHLNQEQQQQIQTAHNMMDYYLHLNWGRVPKLLLYGQEDHSNNNTNNHYKNSKERADDDDNNNNNNKNVFPLPLWSRVLARTNQRQTQPQQQQQLQYTTSSADILFYFLREGPLLKEMR